MKAKLIKDHTDYHLVDDKQFVIGTTDKGMLNCTDKLKLSLKNCQAIERGYNLEELAREMTDKEHQLATQYSKGYEKGIVIGFQKALEFMGDKKFSEEDVKRAFNKGAFYGSTGLGNTHYFDGIIESLQQTEWDVKIEMEWRKVLVNGYKNQPANVIGFVAAYEEQLLPKLDVDGCLILKPLPKE